MQVRIANWILLGGAVAFLLGLASFHVSSATWSWAELGEGWWWYSIHEGRPLEGGLLLLGLGLGLSIVAVAWRSRVLYSRLSVRVPARSPAVLDEKKLLGHVQQLLDREICHPRTRAERLVDTLLGVVVDFGFTELLLAPGSMVVEISLKRDDQFQSVTNMTPPFYKKVLALLRLMIGVEGEGEGEGQIELRSSRRVEQLRILISPGAEGIDTRIQVLSRVNLSAKKGAATSSDRSAPQAASTKPLRAIPSTVLRLENTPPPNWQTGEIPLLFSGQNDGTDSHANMIIGLDPSSESEVMPLVGITRERPVGMMESWLKMAFSLTLAVAVVLYFWEAYGWGVKWISAGLTTAPWRDLALVIRSEPRAGTVTLSGRALGRTPLRTVVQCRGRKIEVVVRTQGFRAWQWSGLCPRTGPLELSAQLQPL
jgi:hypothetical protein